MDAAVYDNHSSYARIHQNSHHHRPHPHTSPLPVPGTHVHPPGSGRVEGEGEARYLALRTLPASPHASRSAPISDATEHDDAVFSYQTASTQASIISKLGMDTSGPPPPSPPPREAGLHPSQPPPPPPSHIRPPAMIPPPFPPTSIHLRTKLYSLLPPPPPPPVLNFRPSSNYQRKTIPLQQQPPREIPPAPPLRMTVGSALEASTNVPTWHQSPGLRAPKGPINLRPPRSTRQLVDRSSLAPKIPTQLDLVGTISTSASSTCTIPRLIDDVASTSDSISDSTSDEDSLALRNSRQFPPLFPTASSLNLQGENRKTSMTNRITTWISQYERDRAPKDRLDMDINPDPLLENFDSAKSHASRGSGPSEETLEILWTKLKDQRVKLNDIKSRMAKKRKKLRDLRRQRDDADNAFMGIIRPMFVAQRGQMGTTPGTLERRLADLQRLRNEYQASENDYEDFEVTLDEEEETLNKLEIRFFSLLAVGQTIPLQRPPEDDFNDDENKNMNMPDDLIGISPDGPPEDLHPLFVDLMATIGDLMNAKEEHEELLFLKEQHEDKLKMKSAAGMELNETEIEFFDQFPLEEEQMRSSVVGLENQVASLRKLCEEKRVMQKHLSARVAYLLYPENGYEDIDLDDTSVILRSWSSLAHPTFPVLLSQPEHVMAQRSPLTPGGALKAAAALPETDPTKTNRMQLATKEYAIDRLMVDHEEGGKGDFINRWLLHQLRLSPANAFLLHWTFIRNRMLQIRDPDRWQRDVLRYWWNDQGAHLSDEMMNLVTSEHSNDGSIVGTHRLSRAVTYTPGMHGGRQSLIAGSSVAHSAWE